ncbi:pentatricopeptide repeat-containing protein At2g20710, mitochondrial isoform X2 [Jatropha curcas]|nr:pentatricopeptide repeat-containing protein At2g20710, mitochondrial isoform X2 [Jatropha curcas]
MNDGLCFDLSPGDAAVQLDLISKVYGIEEAEKYFSGIPENSISYVVYCALLNCYVHPKHLEKAEALIEKMNELGFIKSSPSYNLILNLYSRMGKYEKLDGLLQEMQEKGITSDLFTVTILLNAYVASSDIEKMEKLLMKIEAEAHISMDFISYAVAANGYLKAGLIEKALTMLRKSEQQLININSKRFAYNTLLTLYAAARSKTEVYRIWDLYKNEGFFNEGYIRMIGSLVKLDDMAGAERIWEEWDVGKISFDIRIPHFMIKAYCKKGLWEKAEAVINKIIENGMEPNVTAWDCVAAGYYRVGQMAKAVEAIKKAVSVSKPGKEPRFYNVQACLVYLKGQGDVEAAKELLKMIKETRCYSADAYDKLLSCIEEEKLTTNAFDGGVENDQTGGKPPKTLE